MTASETPDAEKLRIEREKLQAEALSATTRAAKEAREEREAAEPSATAEREALRRQKIAEAEKAVATAQREQMAALVPDFKDVGRGTLENKSEKPMFEAVLGQRALSNAALDVATVVRTCLDPAQGKRVLVTDDAELTVSDATYQDIHASLKQLTEAAQEALAEPEAAAGGGEATPEGEGFAPPLAAMSAVAGAIPALLGVFSARRTLMGNELAKDDLAASAAVVGAILAIEGTAPALVHDHVRLLDEEGDTAKKHGALVALRRRLGTLQMGLEAEKGETPASDKAALKMLSVRLGRITTACSAIDQFTASAVAIPEGANRSPLSIAATRDELHTGHFSHILLVKAAGGSVHQTIDDKPFLAKDKVSILAAASITLMLIDASTNSIVAADTAGGTATAHGKIGDRLQITVE